MLKTIGVIFCADNMYFVAIMLAAIAFTHVLSRVINAIRNSVEERSAFFTGVIDVLSIPFMLLILNACYGIGFQFLRLPFQWVDVISSSPSVVLSFNIALAILYLIRSLLLIGVRSMTLKSVNTVSLIAGTAFLCIIIFVYYAQLISVLLSAVLTFLFIVLSQAILSSAKPVIKESTVVPKKLVISHVYISIAESHDQIAQALDVIKKAIAEIPGTGEQPQVTASAFTPGAIDLLIKYFIIDASKIENIKSDVNLNIIRRLSEKNIKLSSA